MMVLVVNGSKPEAKHLIITALNRNAGVAKTKKTRLQDNKNCSTSGGTETRLRRPRECPLVMFAGFL